MSVVKEGLLLKYGRKSYKSNKERWFVIYDDGEVVYYKERSQVFIMSLNSKV